jgi:RNA polymerase sigma-70 factor, ECF subfamily
VRTNEHWGAEGLLSSRVGGLAELERQDNSSLEIARARRGSQAELGALLDSFRPLMKRLAQQRIGPKLQVRLSGSDLVQETLLSASQSFESFRGNSVQELRQWLLTIFNARLNDGLRRHILAERRSVGMQNNESVISQAAPGTTASSIVMQQEQTSLLVDAMLELPDTDRTILLLRYTEQLSFEDIAQRVDLSLSNVWRRWSRSIATLRKHLEQ